MVDVKILNQFDLLNSVKLHTLRSGSLPFKNACHFYLVCPCHNKDIKYSCSQKDLEEFFCENYSEVPICMACNIPRELNFQCPEVSLNSLLKFKVKYF